MNNQEQEHELDMKEEEEEQEERWVNERRQIRCAGCASWMFYKKNKKFCTTTCRSRCHMVQWRMTKAGGEKSQA